MKGVMLIPDFVPGASTLMKYFKDVVPWDESMKSRKTASYGKPYNYSRMEYPETPFLPELDSIARLIAMELGFKPDNCLINFYPDGKSKMGFHVDDTKDLEPGTGVSIVSLGETRTLRFKNIENPEETIDIELPGGSLFHMDDEVQKVWKHAIPKQADAGERISLTFRKVK